MREESFWPIYSLSKVDSSTTYIGWDALEDKELTNTTFFFNYDDKECLQCVKSSCKTCFLYA